MPSVGRKFLLAGRSGLNITHSEPIERLLSRYGDRPRPALPVRSRRSVRRSCVRGAPRWVNRPSSDRPARCSPCRGEPPRSCVRGSSRLATLGVTIEVRHRWLGFAETERRRRSILDGRGSPRPTAASIEVESDVTVLALGGASWPRVGSDGTWVEMLRRAGRGGRRPPPGELRHARRMDRSLRRSIRRCAPEERRDRRRRRARCAATR